MGVYIHNSQEFKSRKDIDVFNDKIETCFIKILNNKSKNVFVTGV